MSYSALFENGSLPKWAIGGNEFRDTGVTTDFRCVYDKQFVVGDDMYRIFDPMLLSPVIGTGEQGDPITSPTAREYIVEVTGNGFFNLHHRMPIAMGEFTHSGESDIIISNGWRLPNALLPVGAMPITWPTGFGYGLFGDSHATENVVWVFNDLYNSANFGLTAIAISNVLQKFIVSKNLEANACSVEFFFKDTTDSYTHRFYALGTSLGISKHTDGNNEDVTVRIRLLRRQLAAVALTPMVFEEEPQ